MPANSNAARQARQTAHEPRQKVMVVAIDGPSGVGKSTVARELARRLQWRHLDTGAMYRAVSLAVIERGVPEDDEDAMAGLTRSLQIEMSESDGNARIFSDGVDVTSRIRTPEVSRMTSVVADVIAVRRHMVDHQRQIGLERLCVAEGRDMGTVVFPDAFLKFYIDAALDVRAQRRCRELSEHGTPQPLDEVREDIVRRDARDSSRAWGALKAAPDAVIIDTSDYDADQVVSIMADIVRQYHKL